MNIVLSTICAFQAINASSFKWIALHSLFQGQFFLTHRAHRVCTKCIFLAKSVELGCILFVLIPATKSLKCNRPSLQLKSELNVFTICTFFYGRVYIKLFLQSLRMKVAGVTYQILQRNLISCLTLTSRFLYPFE